LEDRRLLSIDPWHSLAPAEDPLQSGEIRGVNWEDLNGNGVRDPGEPGVPGMTVYLDRNENGELDPGEPSTLTLLDDPATPTVDEAGTYRLTGVAPGTNDVTEIVPEGYRQTFPPNTTGSGGLTPMQVLQNDPGDPLGFGAGDSIALSPDGTYVYVSNYGEAAVGVYRRHAITNELTLVNVQPVTGPRSLTISPDGNHLYAAGYARDTVSAYRLDPLTGELAHVQTVRDGESGIVGLDRASVVRISSDGRHVFVSGREALTIFRRDALSGQLTQTQVFWNDQAEGDEQYLFGIRATSPDGRYVYSIRWDTLAVFLRNPLSGELTLMQMLKDGEDGVDGLDEPKDVAVSPDGCHVYVAGCFDDAVAVFRRDAVTGELVFVQVLKDGQGGVEGLDQVNSVAVSPDGTHVYTTGGQDSALTVFRRNAVTGELSFAQVLTRAEDGIEGLANVDSVAVSPDGNQVYTLNGTTTVFHRDKSRAAFHTVTVAPNETVENIDFGRQALPGEIHGRAWNDENADGLQDPGEAALGGWTIYLDVNENGCLDPGEPSTTTEWDGTYAFTGLSDGGYKVTEVLQGQWQHIIPATGARTIWLTAGQIIESVDFGNHADPGEIRGLKWQDRNGNGQQDPGEPGMAGVTVFLDRNDNGQLDPGELSTVTRADDPATPSVDETGTYQFTGLVAGEYTVAEIVPEGNEQTFPSFYCSAGELTFQQALWNGRDGVEGLGGVDSVAISPDGAHVYTTGVEDDTVVVFRRDAVTGGLSLVQVIENAQGDVTALEVPRSVTVSPDGSHVYVASYNASAITVFGRDPASGELTFLQVLRHAWKEWDGLEKPYLMIASPDGRHIYVASRDIDTVGVFSRDAVTGELTFVQLLREGENGVTGLNEVQGLAISPEGDYLYTVVWGRLTVFRRDPLSGELSLVQMLQDGQDGVDGLGGANSVTVSPEGSYVYATGPHDGAVTVFQRDALTAELALVHVLRDDEGGLPDIARAQWSSVSPDGNHVYLAGGGRLMSLQSDRSGGQLSIAQVVRDDHGNVLGLAGLYTFSVAVSPDGHQVYAASGADDALTIFRRDKPRDGFHRVTVDRGQVVAGIDFGSRIPPGEIHGMKWYDFDADGVKDPGEAGLDGWTIYVDLDDNGSLDPGEPSTVTDADGRYVFTEIHAGTYTVAEVPQADWQQTAPPAGTHTVSLTPAQIITNADFGGFIDPPEIHGTVWQDLDGDGQRDIGEPAMAGVTVYLDLDENNRLDPGEPNSVTPADDPATPGIDETGTYRFANLTPGTYTVVQLVPDTYKQTSPPDLPGTGRLTFSQMLQ
ncbi:MAG TPA: beta-propeller fold lactonase family protein, partial [Thermoguttaceae bacterium]|nr:beta-propeller fold lactonase family protein [Thermoguttaceae bacterium]